MLRSELPGNDPAGARIPLAADIAGQIEAAFDVPRGTLAPMISPLEADRLERVLAEWVSASEPGAAIVVSADELRPLVQRMLWRHHPDVSVLAQDETLEAQPAPDSGTLS
jgi:flagellar biosynthesis component FlhA